MNYIFLTAFIFLFSSTFIRCHSVPSPSTTSEYETRENNKLDIDSARTYIFFRPSYRRRSCLSQKPLTCYFRPTTDNTVEGLVQFDPVYRYTRRLFQRSCFVRITASIKNLTPGLHGLHVHTYGDVRFMNGTSTGGHFTDPTGDTSIPHKLPEEGVPRHWGDFGNLEAGKDGMAQYSRIDDQITLSSVIGRGMIIHALEDQGFVEQPTGASGARQAQCVIGIRNVPAFD